MNVLINGIEFAKTGTHGCRWVATHWMDESYMSMMTDSACDQIAELRAEVSRLSAENARLRAVRDAAQAGPFPPWISDDVNEFGERECFGCQRHGVEGEHSPRCRFGPIAAALRAAGGG